MSDCGCSCNPFCGCDCHKREMFLTIQRAEQAEALVGRLREDLSKARASMDAAANIIRGLEDDPAAVRVALAKLDFGRQEAKTALALADPTGARLAPPDGPLLTCPWCGVDQAGRIANAQISHLIGCGDLERARLRDWHNEEMARLAEERRGLNAWYILSREDHPRRPSGYDRDAWPCDKCDALENVERARGGRE